MNDLQHFESSTFEADVLHAKEPVVVDFTAVWWSFHCQVAGSPAFVITTVRQSAIARLANRGHVVDVDSKLEHELIWAQTAEVKPEPDGGA